MFPVHLPPLREPPEDILPLAEALLARSSAALGVHRVQLGNEARDLLVQAAWPGNIRELANVIERALILSGGAPIGPEHLTLEPSAAEPDPAGTLAVIERTAIEQALAQANGNRRIAAERLGIGLRTLYEKLKRYESGV